MALNPKFAATSPAFPGFAGSEGITIRDYFAAKAMQGLCANPGGPFQANGLSGWGIVNCERDDVAELAYRLGDAMLRARAAGAEKPE